MADTSNVYSTMQGLGITVSASGQSEKAGSQVSSSKTATLEPMDEDEEGMQVDDIYEENSYKDEEYMPDVVGENKDRETFDQLKLNDLVRDIGLSKEGSEHLAAILKKKKIN
ncbi:hypothetical protein EVAR_4662_1 [Eumeta japonica]|uniref:Uncharacterized protein n=1 Tax=Eumeta variegata TaxID=151549 RepID=A0A4C1YA02_EUMVA|nr:hypothetical protein EVAR_4662_1 [Eumeta japonica]